MKVGFLLGDFGTRRRAVRAWTRWECSGVRLLLANGCYRMRHPVLMAEVDRRVRLIRQGIEVLDA